MNKFPCRVSLAGLLVALAVGTVSQPPAAAAEEFHFVIHDVEDTRAAWSPPEVVIHKGEALKEGEKGLVFVLENPTPRTHVFEVPGLFELLVEENGDATVKPLRITVAPGETLHVYVSTAQFAKGSRTCAEGEQSYRFFCPLHKGDADLESTIRVVP